MILSDVNINGDGRTSQSAIRVTTECQNRLFHQLLKLLNAALASAAAAVASVNAANAHQ